MLSLKFLALRLSVLSASCYCCGLKCTVVVLSLFDYADNYSRMHIIKFIICDLIWFKYWHICLIISVMLWIFLYYHALSLSGCCLCNWEIWKTSEEFLSSRCTWCTCCSMCCRDCLKRIDLKTMKEAYDIIDKFGSQEVEVRLDWVDSTILWLVERYVIVVWYSDMIRLCRLIYNVCW